MLSFLGMRLLVVKMQASFCHEQDSGYSVTNGWLKNGTNQQVFDSGILCVIFTQFSGCLEPHGLLNTIIV